MSHICVLGVPNLPLFTTLIIEFGTVPTVWYFLFFTSLASKLQSSLFAFIRALSINSRSTKNIKYYNMLFAHIKYGHANRDFPCSCHQLTFWSTPLFFWNGNRVSTLSFSSSTVCEKEIHTSTKGLKIQIKSLKSKNDTQHDAPKKQGHKEKQ
jgi:hypothetical protein